MKKVKIIKNEDNYKNEINEYVKKIKNSLNESYRRNISSDNQNNQLSQLDLAVEDDTGKISNKFSDESFEDYKIIHDREFI